MDKLIINVALTGCVAHRADNPALPVTPEEVAADARRCADLGATIFHVHARDRFGNATTGTAAYKRYIDAVREAVPGAVICASCSGRVARDFGERASALEAGPDMGSLTLGSVDFETGTAVNSRATVRALARRMKDLDILPECEAFYPLQIARIGELKAEGLLPERGRLWVNVFFGDWFARLEQGRAIAQTMYWKDLWAFAGIGAQQWPANQLAVVMGGHVRTGLEDNLKMDRDTPATNMSLVERVVRYAKAVGRELATFEETREALGLPKTEEGE